MTRYPLLGFTAITAGAAWLVFFAISPSEDERYALPTDGSRPIKHSQLTTGASLPVESDMPVASEAATVRAVESLGKQLLSAISDAENLTDPAKYEIRAETWRRLVVGFPLRELENVLKELNSIQQINPTDSGHDLQLRVLQRLAEHDIRAAAEALAGMQPDDRLEACERVAGQWARQDFGEAIAWARQLGELQDRERALIGIAAEAVTDHPAEVLTLASEVSLPAENQDIVVQAAARWAAIDSHEALNWARRIPDSPLRQEVIAAVAVAWADQDAKAAARLVIESLPSGADQENALVGVVQRLAIKDLNVTKAWTAQFPAGPLRERAERELSRIAGQR